ASRFCEAWISTCSSSNPTLITREASGATLIAFSMRSVKSSSSRYEYLGPACLRSDSLMGASGAMTIGSQTSGWMSARWGISSQTRWTARDKSLTFSVDVNRIPTKPLPSINRRSAPRLWFGTWSLNWSAASRRKEGSIPLALQRTISIDEERGDEEREDGERGVIAFSISVVSEWSCGSLAGGLATVSINADVSPKSLKY